jgi:hypothetical protein
LNITVIVFPIFTAFLDFRDGLAGRERIGNIIATRRAFSEKLSERQNDADEESLDHRG